MNDVKIYDLCVNDLDEHFLCHAIKGFEGLWAEYTNSSFVTKLECIISAYFGLPRSLSYEVAPLIRDFVKDLVPTSMTVAQLDTIIQDHIKIYFFEKFGE